MAISLAFGTLFTPVSAEAGLFSAIFGTEEVSAETDIASNQNSQTMGLLQANVSSTLIMNEKSTNKEKEGNSVDLNSDVKISDNALFPVATPLGGSADVGGDLFFDEVSVYVVRSGDTLSQVAEMFGVSVDTILSANDMKKGDKLKVGDVLLILPFSGVEHTIIKGQTLQGIANLYKVDIDDILFYNEIESSSKIAIGQKLIIPGAALPSATSSSSSVARVPVYRAPASQKSFDGYYSNPVPNSRRSRGITATHRGVDLAAPTGTSIYASAEGKVKFARMGYNGGFGNLVIISHPNGTETLYAHMSSLATTPGATVTQGQVIGFVGSTGRSTGPHLHFEVHGAKNPGVDGSWKY